MRRFLPTRYDLVHKFGTLRKTATPATRCNSWLAGSISRLSEIFVEKTQKNSSDAPTSRSHNFSFQTLIHAKFISLESRLLKLSDGTQQTHFQHQKAPKICLEDWVKKLYRNVNQGGSTGGATEPHHAPRNITLCETFYKLDPSPHSSKLGSSP